MRAGDWRLVAESFSEDAVRIPPHEEPHRGRAAIAAWLGGIEELITYELTRDAVDGADGIAYIRGRYAITLRPAGAPGPLSDQGDFSRDLEAGARWDLAGDRSDLEHTPTCRPLRPDVTQDFFSPWRARRRWWERHTIESMK